MADSWEDFDEQELEQQIAVAKGAYQEEDDDAGQVLDSWEDEDESVPQSPSTTAAQVKKKRNIQQIVKERQEAEEKRQKELAAKKAAMEVELNEDPVARKARLNRIVQDSDFQNARDLFGSMTVSDAGLGSSADALAGSDRGSNLGSLQAADSMSVNAGTESADSILPSTMPKSKDEAEKLAQSLADKVSTYKLKTAVKYAFTEKLIRGLVDSMEYTDIRKLSSLLSTVANDKQRAEKDKKSGKKAATKKAQVRVDNDDLDGAAPGGFDAGDYDDFM